jgi:hypothetical protein
VCRDRLDIPPHQIVPGKVLCGGGLRAEAADRGKEIQIDTDLGPLAVDRLTNSHDSIFAIALSLGNRHYPLLERRRHRLPKNLTKTLTNVDRHPKIY